MDITTLTPGTPVLARIGDNVVHATFVETLNDRMVSVRSPRTGKVFSLAVRKVSLDPEATTSSAPAPTPAPAPEAPKKKTLLAIAYEIMEADHRPMSTTEILDLAEERGIFKPEEWGHTPTLTLYGTFVRESKKDAPKVRKSEARGKWELVTLAESMLTATPAN